MMTSWVSDMPTGKKKTASRAQILAILSSQEVVKSGIYKIFCVFLNSAPWFGQIPDPEDIPPDPALCHTY